jgi:adenosylmethionine-8-amino-7-oxononanoate aminotransferase
VANSFVHGFTFAGHPIYCAVAMAAAERMRVGA